MSKSFIHQHIKNIKTQRDSSALSVPVKTTPITPVIVNQNNIASSNLTLVIKEISRIKEAQQLPLKIEEDRLAKEREAAKQERIRKADEHQKQEKARLLREAEERKLLELEREKLEQARRLEEERVIREQLAAQKLEEQRLAMLEQQRLLRETQERLAHEKEEQRIRLELEQRLAREVEERTRSEQEKLVQEQQALQLLQPVQILAPEIPVELPVLEPLHLEEAQPDIVLAAQEIHQDIQEPLESVVIAHVEPELLHPIAEVQINEQEVIGNEKILEQPLQEKVQPQLLPPLQMEKQPVEIQAAVGPLELQPLEHPQEEIIEPSTIPAQLEIISSVEIPAEIQYIEEHYQELEIPKIQEPLAPIKQPLVTQIQGGEESDFDELHYVSDFSDLIDAKEGEYVMVELGAEHYEL